ncbi:DUF4890 domain-containing protein [uncultured Bacteroides sp.]|uniref:DUF4890 domain-containing protein n=1 Tax=uncultured Bacteroides sp. TaxID=162156 RepID=UPI00261F9E38|nr:DUF4890 domain-containing protein [uncultured Bacteroides sp.]
MKKFGTLWLLAVCLTCGAVQMQAQEQRPDAEQKQLPREVPSPEKAARRMTDRMKEELQLTDKQYDKIYKLNLKGQKKLFEAREEQGMHRPPMGGHPAGAPDRPWGGDRGMGPAMGSGRPPMGGPGRPGAPGMTRDTAEDLRKAAQSREKKIKKILTDEQYAKWQEMDKPQRPAPKQDGPKDRPE